MTFWRSETLRSRLPDLITTYDDRQVKHSAYDGRRVKHGAYELSLFTESVVTSEEAPSKTVKSKGENLHIPPGQFGVLYTEEFVSVPKDALALISVKYKYKKRGLINVSGFHVDPGYDGRLRFSVYNAGPSHIYLTTGEPTFLIWYASLDGETQDLYDGEHQGQSGVTDIDLMDFQIDVASPQVLKLKLDDVAKKVSFILWAGGIIVAGLIGREIVNRLLPPQEQPSRHEAVSPAQENELNKHSEIPSPTPLPGPDASTNPAHSDSH